MYRPDEGVHRRGRMWLALALLAGACLAAAMPPADAATAAHASAKKAEPAHRSPAAVSRDWQFMRGAAAAGLAQIEAGKLAAAHAQSPAVRALGKRLVREYTKVNRRLRLLTLRTQVPLPSRPTAPMRRQLQRLQRLQGAAFDATFLAQFAVAVQRDTLSLYEDEATSSGGDAGLRQLAQETATRLQATLRAARKLHPQDASGERAPD